MAGALAKLEAIYAERDGAARAWKAAGGRVVGYFCDVFPEELVIAAGLLPVRLSGDPSLDPTDTLRKYVGIFAGPFSGGIRSPGSLETALAKVLTGGFDFLDYLVIPHSRKAIGAFYRHLTLAQREYPELRLPELHYLDKAYTPFYASARFDRERLFELRSKLEAWTGKPISAAAVRAAIETVNESKALLARVAEARAARPSRLTGVEALALIGSSLVMPKAEHNRLLREALAELEGRTPAAQPRVFVAGSPLDQSDLYRVVESCGATVVGEDHCWGNRCAEDPLPELEGDPFEALAERFHRKPACSIEFPLAATVGKCTGRAVAADVDAAIFWVAQTDGIRMWEVPDERRALEARGIPSLYLQEQPYRVADPGPVREQVSAFLATLRPPVAR